MTKKTFDLESYVERATRGPCFICRTVARDPDYLHHIVYEDAWAIAFLNNNPTLAGYTLVCAKEHRRAVTGDFTREEYLRLQALVHRIGEGGATRHRRRTALCAVARQSSGE